MIKYKHMILISALLFSCSEPTNGVNGLNGEDGVDGTNGFNTLVHSEAEPVGENCTTGGTKLSFGLDEDEDGFLDIEEVRNTVYVCNGEDGQDGENGQDGQDGEIISSDDNPFVGTWYKEGYFNINDNDTIVVSEDDWSSIHFTTWHIENRYMFITDGEILFCLHSDCEYVYLYNFYTYTEDAFYIEQSEIPSSGNDLLQFYNFDSSGNTIYFRETITNDSTGLREVWERME